MLVRITNSCRMGCPHCLVDAKPDGKHMTIETFKQALLFASYHGYGILILSGGEPTDHPDITHLLDLAAVRRMHVSLLSNGQFLYEDPGRREYILNAVDMVQVTNDPRYYPVTLQRYDDPKVKWETRVQQMVPLGRAKTNNLPTDRFSPSCFNLRSATRQLNSFSHAIAVLRSRGKLCTPSINIDGTLAAGETTFCSTVGTVWDDELKIRNHIRDLRCDRCGLLRNLPEQYQKAVTG